MQWSDIPRQPATSTIRWFASLLFMWLLGLGGVEWFVRQQPVSAVVLVLLSLIVGPLGLIRPQAMRPVFVGALLITFPLGWLTSRLLLGAVFYCVFTPLGLFFQLIGRDPLGCNDSHHASTYWQPKRQPDGLRSYFHQS
jgi:hypothetical protein